ncbi:DUF3263 domain-containing protein [Falsarthrobacter nasiphocae]|uniref:DUF3263 domain-containing protein n=1 Tax=Falsarthrobacter nasiphocae TaxID=189863 RepID=A0AAE4C7U5_9MICC|nr:DUF3263 domain-containing protein [Falsarthrobacter nasiphocae]MDR6891745.1 hypothetical protein [Falsarthrobacter nasiphocae]
MPDASPVPQPSTEGDGARAEAPAPLTPQERASLELESEPWKHTAPKDRAIRTRLGLEPVDHYLMVRSLLQDPRAAREFPALVARLSGRVDEARSRYSLGGWAAEAPAPPAAEEPR